VAEHGLFCTELDVERRNCRVQDNCEDAEQKAACHARLHILAHLSGPVVDAAGALACLVLDQAHGPDDWPIASRNQNFN
jgi:hypothetical protein